MGKIFKEDIKITKGKKMTPHIETKNFYSSKDTIKGVKRQDT
jgi:hypothetical protein